MRIKMKSLIIAWINLVVCLLTSIVLFYTSQENDINPILISLVLIFSIGFGWYAHKAKIEDGQ